MTSEDAEQLLEASLSSADHPIGTAKAPETTSAKHKTISCTQCRRRKLKCDRGKPSCGTCSRLRHECVYPEGRVRSTAKRRNVKDLEARLAQVETLLSSEVASKFPSRELPIGNGKPGINPGTEMEPHWDDFDIDMIMSNDISGAANQATSRLSMPPLMDDLYFSNELIGFGLHENLPPRETIDELHNIFFATVHAYAPSLQKYRYLASAHLLPPLGPPVCLRYAVWAVGASCSEKYSKYQEVFYQRARKYAEIDEMKGQGEYFITVGHAQCWSLISSYEAQTMYLSRAWFSAGKSIRLVQMMNLHRIDGDGDEVKQILPPARDWTELEERRRTFWTAFCCDRYSCAGTGWPMTIDERDITTHLPASEEAFEQGQPEITTTLSEAMTAEGAARVSPYAGVILMACLFGHNWLHLHRPGPNDRPEDFVNGEFWKRHRQMENVFSNTLMFLPERLRLPAGLHDPNIVFLNMNVHASTICLHQAAILKVEKHGLDQRIMKQSQARCRSAALEIVSIMRLIGHFKVSDLNPWVSFNLYIATGVLIEGCQSPETRKESQSNLNFLLAALQIIGRNHVVTQAFITQLKIDMEVAGIASDIGEINENENVFAAMGAPTIFPKSFKSGVVEFSGDALPQSSISNRASPSVSGSSESCNTTDKESASPPKEFFNAPDLRGILPRQGMTDRLRRATQFGRSDLTNPPQNNATSRVPNFFNIPALLAGFPVQKSQAATTIQNNRIATASTSIGGQQPSLPSTFAYQQQIAQSSNNGANLAQDVGGMYIDNATNGIPPDWAFGPIDNSILRGFSGFEFPTQEGQEVNSLMNGELWARSTFHS